ncbi:MAG: Alkanesulfonate monooxygenase [Chlorobi bacterium]|nr:Alkanesulfonate monooxygenase [Chlorobiota bacterium]
MPIRFHWRLMPGGERSGNIRDRGRTAREMAFPDLEAQTEFCRAAEHAGADSLLVNMNYGMPDPVLLAAALAHGTERIRFMIANRPGLMSPTLFVQQVNTLAALSGGRVHLNMVVGHSPEEQRYYGDMLDHDARYERMDDYLWICHALWDGGGADFHGRYYQVEKARLNTRFVAGDRDRPEIFVGGSSAQARAAAMRHGTCWVRFAGAPDAVRREAEPALDAGVELGLRLSIIARPTRGEALDAAYGLIDRSESGRAGEERDFVRTSDAVSMRAMFAMADTEWLTPTLWTGAIRKHGATAVALVGSHREVADGLMEFAACGASNFILSGWPKLEEMVRFGEHVLPLIRAMEGSASPVPAADGEAA